MFHVRLVKVGPGRLTSQAGIILWKSRRIMIIGTSEALIGAAVSIERIQTLLTVRSSIDGTTILSRRVLLASRSCVFRSDCMSKER